MFILSKCSIRRFKDGDENSLQENANNTAVWRNLRDGFPNPFTLDDAANWINLNKNYLKPLNFAITVDDEVVGGIGVVQQSDIYQRSAEMGYWLGEAYWGRGIMTEAVIAMVDYTFTNFNVVRIYAGVFDYNIASMRVLEKAGFYKEAIHQKAIFKNGKLLDEHLYVLMKADADKIH